MSRLPVSRSVLPFLSGLVLLGAACGEPQVFDSDAEADADRGEQALLAAAARDCDPMLSVIKNGDFSLDLSDWTREIHEPTSATISVVTDGAAANKVVRVRNAKVQDFYKVQFWQQFGKIERDHCYRLCFRAKASAAREIKVQVQKNAAPWDSYGLWLPESVGAKWTTYKTEFWANTTAADARLTFLFGDDTAAAYVDNVVLIDRGDIDTCAVP